MTNQRKLPISVYTFLKTEMYLADKACQFQLTFKTYRVSVVVREGVKKFEHLLGGRNFSASKKPMPLHFLAQKNSLPCHFFGQKNSTVSFFGQKMSPLSVFYSK